MLGNSPRTVVITGGGSGIGKATAATFVEEGDTVVIIGRTAAKLRAVADELGDSCSWIPADVADRSDVERAITVITSDVETIDVLVNNAGFVCRTSTDMPLSEAEEKWDTVIDTNLKGSYLVAVAATPHMPRPGGRIINVSSIAARTGGSSGGAVAYSASKAGVHGLTFGLARGLSSDGITVNAVAPGFIAETEFTGNWSEKRVNEIVDETPVGRAGSVEDIAACIAFLAAEASSFVTGQVVDVNGGWQFGR